MRSPAPALGRPSLRVGIGLFYCHRRSEDLPVDDLEAPSPAKLTRRQKNRDAGLAIVAEERGPAHFTLPRRGDAGPQVAISSITNNFRTRQNLIYSIYRLRPR